MHRAGPGPPARKVALPRARSDDFIVLKPLGKGSFATVLKVQRKADGKVYALKKVDISKLKRKELSDCLSEIRFLASLKHPNIVRYVDSFLDDRATQLHIVMEFADGGDLSHAIERATRARSRIPEELVWAYFIQILDGLAYLHRKRILHRDLKAANCFLTLDGHVKLGDLNVSKLARNGLAKTQIGTPYYMSPEIFSNRSYDDKSDMWAAGVVLFELCALTPPFKGRDIDDLARNVTAGRIPKLPPGYSHDMEAVIHSLLQLNPALRPSAVSLLADARIASRRALIRAQMENTAMAAMDMEASLDMLGTIAVPAPAAMRRLADELPAAQYPAHAEHVSPRSEAVAHDSDADFISIGVRDSRGKKAAAAGAPPIVDERPPVVVAATPARRPGPAADAASVISPTYTSATKPSVAPSHRSVLEPVRPARPGRPGVIRPLNKGAHMSTHVNRNVPPPAPAVDLDLLLNEASRAGVGLRNVEGSVSPAAPSHAARGGGGVGGGRVIRAADAVAMVRDAPVERAPPPRGVRASPADIAAAARAEVHAAEAAAGGSAAYPVYTQHGHAVHDAAPAPRGVASLLAKIQEEKAYYASQLSAVSQPTPVVKHGPGAVGGRRHAASEAGGASSALAVGERLPPLRSVPSAPALSYARPSWWG